jgi:hypothetical protein
MIFKDAHLAAMRLSPQTSCGNLRVNPGLFPTSRARHRGDKPRDDGLDRVRSILSAYLHRPLSLRKPISA